VHLGLRLAQSQPSTQFVHIRHRQTVGHWKCLSTAALLRGTRDERLAHCVVSLRSSTTVGGAAPWTAAMRPSSGGQGPWSAFSRWGGPIQPSPVRAVRELCQGSSQSAPLHLDAVGPALRPVRRTLPALGHRIRRAVAGRCAVAAAFAVSARTLTDLGLRQGLGAYRVDRVHRQHYQREAEDQYTPINLRPAITSTNPSAFKITGDANRIPNAVPTMAPSSTATA
jgi:hypothetical protein